MFVEKRLREMERICVPLKAGVILSKNSRHPITTAIDGDAASVLYRASDMTGMGCTLDLGTSVEPGCQSEAARIPRQMERRGNSSNFVSTK